MQKRWFAFSARDRAGAVSLSGVLAILLGSVLAQAAPSPVPSEGELDPGFLLVPAYAVQKPEITQLRVGDRVQLKVSGIPAESGVASVMDVPKGSSPLDELGWEVLAQPRESKGEPGEVLFVVTPLKSGKLSLPMLSIQDAQGKAIGRTNPLEFEVSSAFKSGDPQKAKDEAPLPVLPPVGVSFPLWVAIVAVLLGVALIAALVYGLIRWSRSKRPVQESVKSPPKPEDEVALAALSDLEKRGLIHKGQHKKLYFGISETIKLYLGKRYEFDAVESTTAELLGEMESQSLPKGISDWVVDRVETLFERLDVVKFTDQVPSEADAARELEEAKRLVLDTRRPPVVAPLLPSEVAEAAAAQKGKA